VYRIQIEDEADKTLRRMPSNTALRIRSKLLALAEDPLARNPNVKKLSGRDAWRLRIGDWRALYTFDRTDRVILVMVIRPRGGAYLPEYDVISRAQSDGSRQCSTSVWTFTLSTRLSRGGIAA
jgi:mRNA interferase RelE/StbE